MTSRGLPSAKSLPSFSTATRSDELDDGAHQVLDEDDGGALRADGAHQADGIVDLGRVEARQHLVEQQELGPRGERACELEELALVQVQAGRQHLFLAAEAGEADPVQGLVADLGLGARAGRRRWRTSATLSSTVMLANGRGI